MDFTHIDKKGKVNMVDISGKEETERIAIAFGKISLSESTVNLIKEDNLKKGNVLEIAKVGGIFGAKNTSSIIPLTHPIPIEKIGIEFVVKESSVLAFSFAKTHYKTGIEMEAIFSVLSALATVYDMVKVVEREGKIENVFLLYKEGGKSGVFKNPALDFDIVKEGEKRYFVFENKRLFEI